MASRILLFSTLLVSPLVAQEADEDILTAAERKSFLKHSDSFTEYFRDRLNQDWNDDRSRVTLTQRIHQQTRAEKHKYVLLHINYGIWHGERSFKFPDTAVETGLYTFVFVQDGMSWELKRFSIQSEDISKPGKLTPPKTLLELEDGKAKTKVERDTIGWFVQRVWQDYVKLKKSTESKE